MLAEPDAILAAAAHFAAEANRRAAEIEDARRLPADLAQAMAKAGLMRMYVPRAFGGLALSPQTANRAIAIMAEGEASAAWCVMIAATTAITGSYLPQAHAEAVFAAPDGITGGVFAPLGKAEVDGDDVIVTGRWAWASGGANCDWLMGGCIVHEGGAPRLKANGQPEARMFIAPRAEVDLIDTWRVSGLRGTGSGDMAMRAVRIPADRSVSLTDDVSRFAGEGSAFAMPVFALLATGVAAVARGNANGALKEFADLAKAKKGQGASKSMAQRGAVQSEWAKAYAGFRAAEAFADQALDALTARGGQAGLEQRAHVRLACTHMTRAAADLCRALYDLGGGESVYERCPLQRRLRDAQVATQHIMVAPLMYETAGRALLTSEGDWSML